MKTMTCKQLGGACDIKFKANSFDEIVGMSKTHGIEMIQKGDEAHLKAMNKMKIMMEQPQKMQEWFENKRQEFEYLPVD